MRTVGGVTNTNVRPDLMDRDRSAPGTRNPARSDFGGQKIISNNDLGAGGENPLKPDVEAW
jgi:hypothetical protein